MKINKEQIREVGIKAGLLGDSLDLFCAYVEKRGFIREDYSIKRCAKRFVCIERSILNELRGGN